MLGLKSGARVLAILALAPTLPVSSPANSPEAEPDAAAYERVLERFVTPEGRVRYAALKAEAADLDCYLESLAPLDVTRFEAQPEAARIAFWVNAYNAITLKTITDNYPIEGSGLSALRYPASSIRQISGAWSRRSWTVLGVRMSLDDIEHRTLRKRFAEPRIHMALVCAAVGCPPLRREPYDGARLDEQLDDQARRYLASQAGLQLDPGRRRVAVSAIFKWFGEDFEAAGGVRAFLARHAPQAACVTLADPGAKIRYLEYDWSLNEAQ